MYAIEKAVHISTAALCFKHWDLWLLPEKWILLSSASLLEEPFSSFSITGGTENKEAVSLCDLYKQLASEDVEVGQVACRPTQPPWSDHQNHCNQLIEFPPAAIFRHVSRQSPSSTFRDHTNHLLCLSLELHKPSNLSLHHIRLASRKPRCQASLWTLSSRRDLHLRIYGSTKSIPSVSFNSIVTGVEQVLTFFFLPFGT